MGTKFDLFDPTLGGLDKETGSQFRSRAWVVGHRAARSKRDKESLIHMELNRVLVFLVDLLTIALGVRMEMLQMLSMLNDFGESLEKVAICR